MTIFWFILCLFVTNPAFSRGSQEKTISPLEAYYLGRVEESSVALAKLTSPEDKFSLVMLYWELGEMAKAADLLEELLKNPQLKPADKEELYVELFFTYYLMGSYSKAAALRNTVESSIRGKDNLQQAEFYFYSGAIYQEMGDIKRATDTYKKSLDIHKWRPICWYRLGLLLRESNPEEAEKCFQTCWDQDSSFTNTLLPLARLLAARKEWRKARDYLIIANARLPNNKEISLALAEARKNAPGGVYDADSIIRLQINATPPKVKPAPVFPKEGTVRIGLIENRSLVSVKAGVAFFIHTAENRNSLYNGTAGEQFWVQWNNGTLVIQDKNKKALLRSSSALIYELKSNEDSSIVAGAVNGAPGVHRTYRGVLEFRSGSNGITLVNIVPVEDYLYSVVPSEMPYSWPAEALRAQSIAARSYTIAYLGQYADRGFDLFGNARSMAYLGVSAENKNTTTAVDVTRGIILQGGKDPLKAYFSANHGGYSEDTMTLWGYDAYMQAVPDKLLPLRTKPLSPDALYRWIRDNPSTYSNVPRYSYLSSYRWEK